MRLTRLLPIIVLVVAAAVTATGQANNPNNQNAGQDYGRPSVSARGLLADVSHLPGQRDLTPKRSPDRRVPYFELADNNGTCFVMHTTQVARDSKDSDAVHVVSERNCTPSTRFQMKSAVAEPSPEK